MPDQINRAYKLAYFILRDRNMAIDVATRAIMHLDLSARRQRKRTYYKPHELRRAPRKVIWDNAALLELLTLIQSEPYEIRQELELQGYGLTEEDLIVRYVKSLVKYVLSRNSFHATVGICRVLYNYTHQQTAAVYDWLVPDDGGFKYDSTFRLAKQRLKKTLDERFSRFLVEASKQERLDSGTLSDQELGWRYVRIVEESLKVFTPQFTACPPSEFFEQLTFTADLLGERNTEAKASRVEQTRLHIVVCPFCFTRLNARLGNPAPYTQLALPQFSVSTEEQGAAVSMSDSELPDLTFEDFYKILGESR